MRGLDGANRRSTRRSIINESNILLALTTNYNTKSAVQRWKNDRSRINIRWNLMEERPPFDLKGHSLVTMAYQCPTTPPEPQSNNAEASASYPK
jgi:hypothetical protein